MKDKLTPTQLDALKEASNIGTGHAAIALSQMVKKKIMIAVPRSDILPSEVFLKNMVGDKNIEVAGVYLKTLGDVKGAIIFMFRKESAIKLCDLLLFRKPGETKFIDEKCQSVLKEAGSILTGAFFSVLADMLDLKVFHQAPYYAYDVAEIIMNGVCTEIFGDYKERLCLATEFIESSIKIKGSFAFVPAEEAMKTILEKLKAK
tara:strand:- start:74 stop:685 length:612 start_codon:yes stop_codon:yes gene_type:complete